MVSTFDKFELRMNLDFGYVLDGQGAILSYQFDDSVKNLGAGDGNEWFGFDSAVGFCQPLPHDVGILGQYEPLNIWNDLYYDPSLQIIFGDFGSVTPAVNKSARPSWTVPVAIAVPLGVFAIVIVIVILTLTVPSFRRVFITHFGKMNSLPEPEDGVKPSKDDVEKSFSSSSTPNTRQWQASGPSQM